VLPYYLHKNDPVAGTAHFEVSIERGKKLIEAMRASLPGYAVPRFVQELAGEPSKTVLA
jgi:L-lysine 2,3-aminomutase